MVIGDCDSCQILSLLAAVCDHNLWRVCGISYVLQLVKLKLRIHKLSSTNSRVKVVLL